MKKLNVKTGLLLATVVSGVGGFLIPMPENNWVAIALAVLAWGSLVGALFGGAFSSK